MEEEKLTQPVPVYFRPSEVRLLELAAEQEKRSVSNFIRAKVLDKIGEFKDGDELEKKGE